ncbi:cell death abnormality protein 1-like [Saccostrea cucullata]|uniref:cell death abnormality protein 1-like n=1 Tax=Saccostrea cuccullata TaxID=36930 RepID=UPI002ED0A38D
MTCNATDYCTSCREGWSGRICQCNVNCKDECGENGKCTNGCKGSFYGDYCNISCPIENCQICDQKFANCTKCKEGLYGTHCDMECSITCVGPVCDMGGECLQGCQEGFTGEYCWNRITQSTDDTQTKPYIIAVSVLGVLLVITFAVLLFIFLVKRRRDRERRVKETYESVQVTFQETDHQYESVNRELAH